MLAQCCGYRDVGHVTVSLHQRVHSVMILLDSVVASQELQVSDVNVVSLASGTIVRMDACVSQKTKVLRNVMKLNNLAKIHAVDL